jgi:hypothetical protein
MRPWCRCCRYFRFEETVPAHEQSKAIDMVVLNAEEIETSNIRKVASA